MALVSLFLPRSCSCPECYLVNDLQPTFSWWVEKSQEKVDMGEKLNVCLDLCPGSDTRTRAFCMRAHSVYSPFYRKRGLKLRAEHLYL